MKSTGLHHLALLCTLMTACVHSPDTMAPPVTLPEGFKEDAIWKVARPAAHQERGEWWRIFGDSDLNGIMEQVSHSNQSLQAQSARASQAATALKSAKLAFFPDATGNASFNAQGNDSRRTDSRSIGISSSWELDLWGRLRHQARAVYATAEASQADTESLKLSLQAQAATAYFSLMAVDAQRDLYQRQMQSYEKSLSLTKNRYNQGVASRADVSQAESQLASTQANAYELESQRALLEHTLANLMGMAPSQLSLGKRQLISGAPSAPRSTPSQLLQRRPDIYAAERRVAVANENIGAAKAAFFPTLSLGGSTGWNSTSSLFSAPTFVWSLGPSVTAPIFQRGALVVQKAQADESYKAAVADYRQTVLDAFQEAEDALATLGSLEQQATARQQAVKSARETERITLNQYQAGTVSFLNVTTAQAIALNSESNMIDLQARRLNTTVALIKALGGRW
jgi:NodT family efflux transporter outer membrane factor (OMF) lipoprotein